jgi:hypothetical protein
MPDVDEGTAHRDTTTQLVSYSLCPECFGHINCTGCEPVGHSPLRTHLGTAQPGCLSVATVVPNDDSITSMRSG